MHHLWISFIISHKKQNCRSKKRGKIQLTFLNDVQLDHWVHNAQRVIEEKTL